MKILTYWPGSVHGYGVREKEPDEKMWDDLGRPSPYKQGRRVMTGDQCHARRPELGDQSLQRRFSRLGELETPGAGRAPTCGY